MHGKLKKEGQYELFKTTHGHQVLTLDQKEWYAVVETNQGHILVKSDSDHQKDKTISKGKFYLADFQDDPEFRDMPHLFMADGGKFKEFVLPQGLPTKSKDRKKVILTEDKLDKDKVEYHVKGKGDQGSEKQYQQDRQPASKGEKNQQDLSGMTKQELYEKAKEQDIEGRSKMNKEELKKKLTS